MGEATGDVFDKRFQDVVLTLCLGSVGEHLLRVSMARFWAPRVLHRASICSPVSAQARLFLTVGEVVPGRLLRERDVHFGSAAFAPKQELKAPIENPRCFGQSHARPPAENFAAPIWSIVPSERSRARGSGH